MALFTTQPKALNFKFLLPLALSNLTIYLIAASVAYKMVAIGAALEPGPPFIFPLSYAIADVIAEVYGYAMARQLIWLTLLCELFYAIIVRIIINLPSPGFWHLQACYEQVFGHIIRFVLAGLLAVISSSFVSVYIIAKWKILMQGKYFWFRSLCASAISGFVLITVITLFGYLGTVDLQEAIRMFISIYLLELIYAAILTWPAWFLACYLKIKEAIDVYDVETNFNPFSFNY